MRDFFGGGVPQEKKSAESPELDFTPFPCPALIRDFCGGGPTRKKVGGVTGIGLHAVSPITQAQKIIENDNSLSLHFQSSTIKQRKEKRPTDD
ncbi:hypothetical protein TNCV_1818491 [Trichonephila clavipes]|nr:hypothetical protein TNCV_1818491 [Trichonephila clavipes]